MGRRAGKRSLTTTEQALRWTGLAMILLALMVGIAEVPGTDRVPLALLVGAVGCFIALAVVSFQEGRRSSE